VRVKLESIARWRGPARDDKKARMKIERKSMNVFTARRMKKNRGEDTSLGEGRILNQA
jgi:hypothetical protein